ncbi:hypothetical protein PsorP6_006906 [Peronosclerospora sorghi]|uniref:Uncharacterized protein n=1 Tax=Peronosclerospora sorghi TaxID=230839 RepID=A0ACC0WAN7_9STRA|nr:hypothetical protein PsorP6_019464 [Peronosclerospora sorghi]KAI9915834.1 hypothetical protein PsorP6_006906 [Peronosclerospora sorghi]
MMAADGRRRRMEEVVRSAMAVVNAVRDAQVAVEAPTRESVLNRSLEGRLPAADPRRMAAEAAKLQASVAIAQANARISLGAAIQQPFQFVCSLVLPVESLMRENLQ